MRKNNPAFIGNNIRKWRTVKGYKQNMLAEMIGISKATLSKIENDKQVVTIIRLQKIAECLNIKATELFGDPMDLLP